MPHPLVEQLRFARLELHRALAGTPEEDALRRLPPMNSIGWIVGHLAWQEQRQWLTRAQDRTPVPFLEEVAANGGPATTPALPDVLAAWGEVTASADPWLDALTTAELLGNIPGAGPTRRIGDVLRRVTYHYWFHIGEILAIRQILGHSDLPEFVGDLDSVAPFRPDDA